MDINKEVFFVIYLGMLSVPRLYRLNIKLYPCTGTEALYRPYGP